MSAKTIKETVAQQIAMSGPAVQEAVIAGFVAKETESRAQAIAAGYLKLEKLNGELKKIDRPDIVPNGRDGKPLGEGTYSKERADAIKKTEEDIDKWDKALTKAWGSEAEAPDFQKLRELIQKDGGNKS